MAKGKNTITIKVNGQNITGTKRELDALLEDQGFVTKARKSVFDIFK